MPTTRGSDLARLKCRRSSRDMGRWAQAARSGGSQPVGVAPVYSMLAWTVPGGFQAANWTSTGSPVGWELEVQVFGTSWQPALTYTPAAAARSQTTGFGSPGPHLRARIRALGPWGFGPWTDWQEGP